MVLQVSQDANVLGSALLLVERDRRLPGILGHGCDGVPEKTGREEEPAHRYSGREGGREYAWLPGRDQGMGPDPVFLAGDD
jgi:hypothetical protein